METNFNFKSQVCTDKNQSEHLLALGLKKETADCNLNNYSLKGKSYQDDWQVGTAPYSDCLESWRVFAKDSCWELIPAWSLHRLIEMISNSNAYGKGDWLYGIAYNAYEKLIESIREMIHLGYFNKEYLENGND